MIDEIYILEQSQHIEKNFTWRIVADRTIEAYQKVC
jgi:hypothetical protein